MPPKTESCTIGAAALDVCNDSAIRQLPAWHQLQPQLLQDFPARLSCSGGTNLLKSNNCNIKTTGID